MNRNDLVDYLDAELRIHEISDYGPQGLQVEAANHDVQRLALAVDSAPPVIEAAAQWGADMLLVHHGLLWRSVERIAGPLGQRVRALMKQDMHLYAAHLALDAHPQWGNNAQLARLLDVTVQQWWCAPTGTPLAVLGDAAPGMDLPSFVARIEAQLSATARVLAHGPRLVSRVAILSGFGADQAGEAQRLGADTLLTGETSHANFYAAADHGINIIYAGHYATETVGVRALGHHLAQQFGLRTQFFDFPTGM